MNNNTNAEAPENETKPAKPVWQAPTLVEFQDELAPEGGMGNALGESALYRPMS